MKPQPGNKEFELIAWIRERAATHPHVRVGIGDDAAALDWPAKSCSLVAADMLLEGVHFTFPPATPRQVGRKALAVNLSDLAAMAAQPVAAFVTVALSRAHDPECARELHEGLNDLASEFGLALAGGDTNVWDGPLAVSVTAIGEAHERGPALRSGGRAGDWIMVTGSLGGSLAGHHLDFTPRVREALAIADAVELHSMIDISDGLAADLHHILDESSVGAVLFADRIPVNKELRDSADDRSPLDHALGDGEDFELLFTVSPTDGNKLLSHPPCDVRLSHIGELTEGGGCTLRMADGSSQLLGRMGWEHSM